MSWTAPPPPPSPPTSPPGSNPQVDLGLELRDVRQRNYVTLRFACYRAAAPHLQVPNLIQFSFRFFDQPPTRTKPALLTRAQPKVGYKQLKVGYKQLKVGDKQLKVGYKQLKEGKSGANPVGC